MNAEYIEATLNELNSKIVSVSIDLSDSIRLIINGVLKVLDVSDPNGNLNLAFIC